MTDGPTRPNLNNVESATMPLNINCGEYIAVLGYVLDGLHDPRQVYSLVGLDSYLPPALIERQRDTASPNYDRHIFTMVKMAISRYCRTYGYDPDHYQVTDIFIGYYPLNTPLPDIENRTNARLVYHMIDKVHYDMELLTELGFYRS